MRRSTSLDLDGLFSTTPELFQEGSPFVTQCPIAPGASYTYTNGPIQQAGNFWYHRFADFVHFFLLLVAGLNYFSAVS
jgi:iron transport multicopper oxidase